MLPLLAQLVEPHCRRQQKLAALIFTSATPGQPLQHNKYAPWNIGAHVTKTKMMAGYWSTQRFTLFTLFTNTYTQGIDLTQETQKMADF